MLMNRFACYRPNHRPPEQLPSGQPYRPFFSSSFLPLHYSLPEHSLYQSHFCISPDYTHLTTSDSALKPQPRPSGSTWYTHHTSTTASTWQAPPACSPVVHLAPPPSPPAASNPPSHTPPAPPFHARPSKPHPAAPTLRGPDFRP